MAPVCKFYLQGNCRNGATCRFEHPGANAGANAYKFTKDSIRVDLTDDRPTWLFSCYGPGRSAPEQLFGGYPYEQSLEEVMLHIRGAANQQQAIEEVTALYNNIQQRIQNALSNLDAAVDFVVSAENKHPNRIDICNQNTAHTGSTGVFAVKSGFDNPLNSSVAANQNAFSNSTQSNPFSGGTTAFGQPSTLGQQPSAFGATQASPFGQPTQMGSSAPAFGQASQMGASAPAFGQTSQLGASGSAFGQPSKMGASAPAFGQTSQMGASGPAFGQTSQLGASGSAFGQPSKMGASTPAFGQASQMGASGPAFGQASQMGASGPAFGQSSQLGASGSAFGQASQMGQRPNPFGAASTAAPSGFAQSGQSTFGQTSTMGQAPSAFGTSAASTSSPFGQQTSTPQASNPFAQASQAAASNPFGSSMNTSSPSTGLGAQTSNPFGAQSTGISGGNPNPFAQAQANSQPAPAASGGSQAKSNPFAPGSTKQHPPVESYLQKSMDGQIMSFKNQPIVYKWKVDDHHQDQPPANPTADQRVPGVRKPDGSWYKIQFPNGPPAYNKDTEPEADQYDEKTKAAYAQMAQSGRFQGDVPEVPPMREDCTWML